MPHKCRNRYACKRYDASSGTCYDELYRLINIYKSRMKNSVITRNETFRRTLNRLIPRNPQDKINQLSQKLDMRIQTLEQVYRLNINYRKRSLSENAAKLDALSPLKTLNRGYSIAVNDDGKVLKKKSDFTKEMQFKLKLQDGDMDCIAKCWMEE